jgi:Mg-chelatase subunit ChlD
MQDMNAMLGMSPTGGNNQHKEDNEPVDIQPMSSQAGGRRRRRSRTRKGRKGKGGYMMDVAVAAGLLGATQYMKRRRGYGSTKKRSSRRSRRSSRSRSRR